MTTTDDAFYKLSVVTAALGRERTRNDNLQADYDILLQAYRDLQRDFAQYKERHEDAIR